jgi:hypothetical protein
MDSPASSRHDRGFNLLNQGLGQRREVQDLRGPGDGPVGRDGPEVTGVFQIDVSLPYRLRQGNR